MKKDGASSHASEGEAKAQCHCDETQRVSKPKLNLKWEAQDRFCPNVCSAALLQSQGPEAGAKEGRESVLSLPCILPLGLALRGNFPLKVRQSHAPSYTTSVTLII